MSDKRLSSTDQGTQIGPIQVSGRSVSISTWLVLSILVLTGFAYQPSALLHTNPQMANLRVGETTTIELMVADIKGLYGAQIRLRFDPEVLEVVDAVPDTDGIQLAPGTFPSPDFVVLNEADNDTGTINYAVTQVPPSKPGNGSGVVAHITFRAVKPSVTAVRFEQFLLADTNGGTIDALPQDGQIEVQSRSSWMLYAVIGAALIVVAGSIGYLIIKKKVRGTSDA
jgi:hypothetical protein